MDVLLITAPTPDSFDNPLVERNARKIGQWLDQLPPLNPAETVGQLLDSLTPLNRQPLPDRERMRLLELYRQAVNQVFNAFTQRSLRQLPVPAAQRERIKQDIARLCLELASGYKSLVLQAHREGRAPAQDPLLAQAAYRAMEQLAHALLHSFRIYGPIPPRVLLEIHQLYAWSEDAGTVDTPLGLEQGATLGGLYRRILLLCCAEPARLSEDEVLRVYALLEAYAGHCRIVNGICATPYAGRFILDLCSDAPPRPCAKFDSHTRLTQPRVLDAHAVAGAVRAQTQGQNGVLDEERRLLRLLLPQLETTPQRVTPRQIVQRPALVAAGIATLHYYLGDGRRLAHGVEQARQGIAVQLVDDETAAAHHLDDWSVGNESESGYLLRSAQRRTPVRVGELLGVLLQDHSESPAALELAVVRWLRNGADGGIEAGVERIVGAAAPVQCQLPAEPDALPPTCQCLFLPSSELQEMPATLLAPKRLYARGRRLRVDVGGKSITVEAGHLLMDTACFDRFAFQALREDSTPGG